MLNYDQNITNQEYDEAKADMLFILSDQYEEEYLVLEENNI